MKIAERDTTVSRTFAKQQKPATPFFQPKSDIKHSNSNIQTGVNVSENSNLQIQTKKLGKKRPPPIPAVSKAPKSVVTNTGKLTSSAITLLNKVTGVDIALLSNVQIKIKPVGKFPFYNPNKGGGAITIGNTISFTVNWFDKTGYYRRKKKGKWENNSYGDNPMEWLRLLSHEVLHLPQAEAFGTDKKGIKKYLWFFVGQYIRYLGHNRVPFEKEAETGHHVFDHLTWNFTTKKKTTFGKQLEYILNNKSYKSEADREKDIKMLLSTKKIKNEIIKWTKDWINKNPKAIKKAIKQKNKADKKRLKRVI